MAIDIEKSRRVHRRVDLRRGQTGVTKQFLKRSEIRSSCKQVSSKTMPKRVRSEGIRQSQSPPGCCNRSPHQVRVQSAAASAKEERRVAGKRIWTLTDIFVDRFPDRGHHRHYASLRPLARHSKRLPNRKSLGGQRQRLGDAKAGAIKQKKDREITRTDPRSARGLRRIFGKAHRLVGRCGARKCSRALGRTGARKLHMMPLLLGGIS